MKSLEYLLLIMVSTQLYIKSVTFESGDSSNIS